MENIKGSPTRLFLATTSPLCIRSILNMRSQVPTKPNIVMAYCQSLFIGSRRILHIIIIIFSFFLTGCRIWNPSRIYKSNSSSHHYADLSTKKDTLAYRIQTGDQLSMFVYTNRGYKLVDAGLASSSGGQAGANLSQITYLVEGNGVARFPLIDTVMILGLTLPEASALLEDRYQDHLVDPWVQMRVVNRRAFVYRGSELASVVSLPNENMTLLEVIASAGGIPVTGKAYTIKLIRGTHQGTLIYKINLRDGTNLLAGQTIVQANDVVLIDPSFETTFLAQLTPFLALITSGLAVYGLFRSLRP